MVSEKRIDMKKLEALLELGGIKKDVTLLALSGAAVICSLCGVRLGGLLEELTVAKARAGIEKLLHLMPQTARVGSGGEEKIIPAEEVQAGEILRVLPGESIPVDGVIISGQTSINQAVMTGGSRALPELAETLRPDPGQVRLRGSRSFRRSRFCARATMRRQPMRLQRRSARSETVSMTRPRSRKRLSGSALGGVGSDGAV